MAAIGTMSTKRCIVFSLVLMVLTVQDVILGMMPNRHGALNLQYIILYPVMLYYIIYYIFYVIYATFVWYYITLYYVILYHTLLYYTILYYVISTLCYIILFY